MVLQMAHSHMIDFVPGYYHNMMLDHAQTVAQRNNIIISNMVGNGKIILGC